MDKEDVIILKRAQLYAQMAQYYDIIYNALVDYESECDFLERLFKEHSKHKVRWILDVGCGTGNHSTILAVRGYNVVGIDRSEAMLRVARSKIAARNRSLQFKKMDMRKVSLGRRFDAALILFGGFTYLLNDLDIQSCLASIHRHLTQDGLLIFEFWQSSGLHPAASTPQGFKTWDRMEETETSRLLIRLDTSKYDPLTNIMTVIFDHYVLDTKNERVVDRFEEMHVMRTYNIAEMKRLLVESGLDNIAFYAKGLDDPPKTPTISTPRIICIASPATR